VKFSAEGVKSRGAEIKTQKALRKATCGEGVSLSLMGEGFGEEAMSPPQNILIFFAFKRLILMKSE